MSEQYAYSGTAYPLHLGGRVEWDRPTLVIGTFSMDDFQDGAGVTLEGGGERWMVPKRVLRESGWPVLTRSQLIEAATNLGIPDREAVSDG